MRRTSLHTLTIILMLSAFTAFPAFSGGRTEIVGKGIRNSDITEFWYTYSTSTNPPHFQRYRFYIDDGVWMFYHERREGNHWPLRESDITVSGEKELSKKQLEMLFSLLEWGTVQKRGKSTASGGSGPWLYLYWKNDKSKYQEFSFASHSNRLEFESFCEKLMN